MKKRILGIMTVLMLILGLCVLFTACTDTTTEKADYSVTVLSATEEPLPDITVNWISSSKKAGSAVTDDNGKASASLPVGTYSIELDGYGEGLSYTSVSVSSATRNVTLTLSVMKVKYSVTVKDKTGMFASGVTVNWSKGNTIAATATTNTSGKAECELDYGDYSVTLASLPEGNIYDGAKNASGNTPVVEFVLHGGVTVDYTVTVKSEGGLLFKDYPVVVFKGDTIVSSGHTDDNGVFKFAAEPENYTATTSAQTDGYTFDDAVLTATERDAEIILRSAIIEFEPDTGEEPGTGSEDKPDTGTGSVPGANVKYVIGDIIHNYSFKTPYELDSKIWESSVSEILKTKKVLILNNWGTKCSYCVTEMPDMQKVYDKYKNDIEIVAVSNYASSLDSDSVITAYYEQNGYTFPMMRDTNGFASKFNIDGWPTTVVIDRYGAIARIETGAIIGEEAWERLVLKYIGDDYIQSFTPGESTSESINTEMAKPDVEIPSDHYDKIAEKMNDTTKFPNGASVKWYGETEYELAWPFMLGTVDEVSPTQEVLYSSNTGKANSMSIIYATVTVDAGKVLTFDYYSQTEENCDILSIVWDGKIVKKISGDSKGWQTCYLYTDLTSGSHTLSLAYIKDSRDNTGKDNVYLRNVRFTELSEITSTDMFRSAAYGTPDKDATQFPYYADVELKEDGYFHVNLSTLQNHAFAGNDNSPLLLANLMNATQWSAYSINDLVYAIDKDTGEYAIDCTLTVNGVTKDYRSILIDYMAAAQASDVEDCVPVDKQLHDVLVEFMKKVSGSTSHPNEWLEACYFYSHYGSGEPIGNPIMGLTQKTAITVTEGTHTADITRNMFPFPSMIYTFTPTKSAVYRIESLIPDELADTYAAQIWLYDDNSSADNPLVYCGDTRVVRDGVNEHNFVVLRYMEAGHKYYLELAYQMSASGTYDFKITEVGASATELTPCSEDTYDMVLDKDGNFTGEIVLSGAIKYVKDEDGYFHAVNPDGTMGDFIYLDVDYASTTALGTIPLRRLVDKYVPDPADNKTPLDYKFFDFRYRVTFISDTTAEGTVYNYNPKVDCTGQGEKYKDYTDILKTYINSAPTEGEYAGLIKVNQEIVDILLLYIEMRNNSVVDGETDTVLENEWLKFCWYYRKYDSNNL